MVLNIVHIAQATQRRRRKRLADKGLEVDAFSWQPRRPGLVAFDRGPHTGSSAPTPMLDVVIPTSAGSLGDEERS